MQKRSIIILTAIVACCFWYAVPCVAGNTFTLSDDDLMSLDSYQNSCSNDPCSPRITAKRDVSGPGVEFDIYFPDTNGKDDSVYYVSSNRSGEGILVDVNLPDYNAFALKFTLISVDGNSEPNTGGQLVVGALVNAYYSFAYRPEVIGFLSDEPETVVSITKTGADKISIVGFVARLGKSSGWSPEGTVITIRVEPAPNAEVPP